MEKYGPAAERLPWALARCSRPVLSAAVTDAALVVSLSRRFLPSAGGRNVRTFEGAYEPGPQPPGRLERPTGFDGLAVAPVRAELLAGDHDDPAPTTRWAPITSRRSARTPPR